VVANAGILPMAMGDPQPMDFVDAVDVDLVGVMNAVAVSLPHLGEYASIIMTGSLAAMMPNTVDNPNMGPGSAGYGWAKRILMEYTEQLALQLGPKYIRVNCIHPTNVNTHLLHNDGLYSMFRPDLEHPTREDVDPAFAMMQAMPVPYEHEEIARRVALLVPEGARLQVGPNPVGDALLRRLTVPVTIDSGLLPDSVTSLASRGLLIGDPVATYLAGGPRLYEWADGRPILHPIEYTHDLGRLSAAVFIAVNTAVEIDFDGQVNVEGTASAVLGGIGGHADYAAAATRSVGGLSVITVTTRHNGKPTLVSQLSRPVSTPSQDVDIVVTERGEADLRGLSRPERHAALSKLWDA
jgi:hypothetical protein